MTGQVVVSSPPPARRFSRPLLSAAGFAALVVPQFLVPFRLGNFLRNVAYIAAVVLVVVIALGTLGVETTPLLAVIGTAGLAIGLALKEAIEARTHFRDPRVAYAQQPAKRGDPDGKHDPQRPLHGSQAVFEAVHNALEALDRRPQAGGVPLQRVHVGAQRFKPIHASRIARSAAVFKSLARRRRRYRRRPKAFYLNRFSHLRVETSRPRRPPRLAAPR